MRRRIRPFDDARELAECVAREMSMGDELPALERIAQEVCGEIAVGKRLSDQVLDGELG